jgi:hypothetical protein
MKILSNNLLVTVLRIFGLTLVSSEQDDTTTIRQEALSTGRWLPRPSEF